MLSIMPETKCSVCKALKVVNMKVPDVDVLTDTRLVFLLSQQRDLRLSFLMSGLW